MAGAHSTLDPAILERAALCMLCSPSNPQGAAASLAQLKELIGLARRHDFVAVFDECYAEIYTGEPPAGALQAAAARVGAPLGHDFCAISLSDLLTPRDTILQRLRAAAEADFVVALYNLKARPAANSCPWRSRSSPPPAPLKPPSSWPATWAAPTNRSPSPPSRSSTPTPSTC